MKSSSPQHAAAGAKHVRIDSCEWSMVEQQTAPPDNASNGYTLPPGCVDGLTYAKKYGLRPTILAAYGAPYHQILTVTTTQSAAMGSYTVPVQLSSSVGGKSLSSLSYPYNYLAGPNGKIAVRYNHANGVLITSSTSAGTDTAVLTLAAALTLDLPAGSTLYVNEILYPSPATGSATDPSIQAYVKYARYLATQISAYGLTGEVELWNEPYWKDDCWDNRVNCYDKDPKWPGEPQLSGPNYGIAAAAQVLEPVSGVNYVWSGTNKSGAADLLGPRMLKYGGTLFTQPQPVITMESFHPYGSNPEDNMWNEPCLLANPQKWTLCNTIPTSTSNSLVAEANNIIAKQTNSNYGINHSITETGASTLYMPADHQARFAMRQYLGYMAANMSYVEFFVMNDPSVPGQGGFGYIQLSSNKETFTPLQNYTALAGFMDDMAEIQSEPAVPYSSSTLPFVKSYSGTYNLDHLAIVGARAGDTANSVAYILYQRSYSPTMCQLDDTVPCWGTLAQPPAATATVTIPSGLKVAMVMNLDTRESVAYTQAGSDVAVAVSDDPVELMLIPMGDGSAQLLTPKFRFIPVAQQVQGNNVDVLATSDSPGRIDVLDRQWPGKYLRLHGNCDRPRPSSGKCHAGGHI